MSVSEASVQPASDRTHFGAAACRPAYVVYLCLMGVGVVGGYMLYLHGSKKVA